MRNSVGLETPGYVFHARGHMPVQTTTLPDGRSIYCVNAYEVDFSFHEIFSDDLAAHGLSLPKDGVYLDVGANIGLFSIYLRDHCSSARIIAFEPMPEAFAALARNMEGLNPPGNAVQLALGAAPGLADFDYFPGVAALSTSHRDVGRRMADGLRRLLTTGSADAGVDGVLQKTGASGIAQDQGFIDALLRPQTVRARVSTLSEQMRELGVGRVDLLKIDTEGAEQEVLAGIGQADWPAIRQLLVEVHLGDAIAGSMAESLNGRGFAVSVGRHPLAQDGAEVFHIYAHRE